MSAELNTKVTALQAALDSNTIATQTAISLIAQLRSDLATASVDDPATLAQLDAITTTLTSSTQALVSA